jgi:hypothetical protein
MNMGRLPCTLMMHSLLTCQDKQIPIPLHLETFARSWLLSNASFGRKDNNIKAHETSTTPTTLTIGDTTYYLNKGETNVFQGHQYITHATITQYFVSQHAVSTNDLALIDRGANGCL